MQVTDKQSFTVCSPSHVHPHLLIETTACKLRRGKLHLILCITLLDHLTLHLYGSFAMGSMFSAMHLVP